MRAFRKRKQPDSPDSDIDIINDIGNEADSDAENTHPPPKKKARDSAKGKSKAPRHCAPPPNAQASSSRTRVEDQRTDDERTSELSELKDVLVQSEDRRIQEQREMREALEESTQVYARTQADLIAAIMRLSTQEK